MSVTSEIAKVSCAKCGTSFVCYVPDDSCQECGGKLKKIRWGKFTKPEDFLRGCEIMLESANCHEQIKTPMALYKKTRRLVPQGMRLTLARRIAEQLMP